MKIYQLAITPLSPMHIGCGEAYEPTNFVIDPVKRMMYGFNPSVAVLGNRVQSQLRNAAAAGTLKAIYNFFRNHVEDFKPWASVIVPMDRTCLDAYLDIFKKPNVGKFEILRNTYELSPDQSTPYLPGSSLKGVIRTALADRLNNGQKRCNNAMAMKEILGGDFDRSPMRFLKVSDFHPVGRKVSVRIRCAKRFYKKNNIFCERTQNNYETIEPCQYRLLQGSVVLTSDQNRDNVQNVYASIEAMMRDLHQYSQKIFDRERQWYAEANSRWTNSVTDLLETLQPSFKSGRMALIRLGKNCGAESKTLSGKDVARIKIHHKDGGKETLDHTTLVGFMTDEIRKNFDNAEIVSGLPVGWALCEVAEKDEDNHIVKAWCTAEAKHLPVPKISLESEWNDILTQRALLEKQKETQRLQEEQMAQKRAEEAVAQARREAELSTMTPERRSSEEMVEKLNKAPGSIGPGTSLFVEVKALLETALGWASAEDKKQLALAVGPLMKKRGMMVGKNEKLFKAQLKTLRGE